MSYLLEGLKMAMKQPNLNVKAAAEAHGLSVKQYLENLPKKKGKNEEQERIKNRLANLQK